MKIKIDLNVLRFKKEQAQAVVNWLIACGEILEAIKQHAQAAKLDNEGIEVLAPEGVSVTSDTGDEYYSLILYPSDLDGLLAAVEKVERKA